MGYEVRGMYATKNVHDNCGDSALFQVWCPQSNLCGVALVAYEKVVHDLPRDDYQEQVTLDGLL